MRDAIKLRLATADDEADLKKWLGATPGSDTGILGYGQALSVLCAYNGRAISYLPMQKVLMLESVASNPDADTSSKAAALSTLVKGATLTASASGMKEIYFLASDDNVAKIAEHHGFTELPWRVMRMRLS